LLVDTVAVAVVVVVAAWMASSERWGDVQAAVHPAVRAASERRVAWTWCVVELLRLVAVRYPDVER